MKFRSNTTALLTASISIMCKVHSAQATDGPGTQFNVAALEKVCSNRQENIIERTPINGEVGYFVKPLFLHGELHYTAVINGRPSIVDSSGKVIATLNGDQDPLVSFDNGLLTVLKKEVTKFNLKFYEPETQRMIKSNIDVWGAYQSIAPIASDGEGQSYRMVIDEITSVIEQVDGTQEKRIATAPKIMEFKKTKNGIVKQSEFTDPCKNERLQIPFLSKKGNLLAALNLKTQTTQIFDISNGKCEFKQDLGFATGKADFNYHDDKITFHLAATPNIDRYGWVKNLGKNNSSNVYVYDLKTKQIQQITRNQNSNSYYPAFLPDGTIAHIDSTPQESGKRSDYSIGRSKVPVPTKNRNAKSPQCPDSKSNEYKNRFAIGQLLHGICNEGAIFQKDQKFDPTYFVLKASELSSKECKELVGKYWDKEMQLKQLEKQKIRPETNFYKDQAQIRKEDVLAGCNQL